MVDNETQSVVGGGECACLTDPRAQRSFVVDLGMDERYRECAILICAVCGQLWLRVHEEDEAFSRSGRWYLGAIAAEQAAQLSAQNARAALEALSWYFYGGSYYDGRTGKTSGRIW